MTTLATVITAIAAAGAAALAGGAASGGAPAADTRAAVADGAGPGTALVIDASAARDGRELVDPRLGGLDAEVRLPRTDREARTNVLYFDRLGHLVVVAGPRSTAAAEATGVEAVETSGLSGALARLQPKR